MKIKAIRGVKDILPQELLAWSSIEEKAKKLCEIYGYRQIRTPLLEEAHLFTRSIGEASDIVRKEMYSFLDRKKRLLCLRPEATASVVRAYLEHGLDRNSGLAKFYYFGPMFRAERPQAGRLRQFHHIGVEAIGSSSPYLDVEVILLAIKILDEAGLKDFTLQLNSIGCQKDRQKYKDIIRKAIKNNLGLLCVDCHSRYRINLLRIFDCKKEACRRIVRRCAPSMEEHLCPECAEHFFKVKQALGRLDIRFILNPRLVRGLDYYTKTCFEITHPCLGAQNAVGAGGRYDNLVGELGGPQKPAVGFALGLERLIAALQPLNIKIINTVSPIVFIATLGEKAREAAFLKLLQPLREKGVFCEMDYNNKSLKAQMRQANKLGAKYAAILGEEELRKEVVILRDMQNKSQREVKIDNLVREIK